MRRDLTVSNSQSTKRKGADGRTIDTSNIGNRSEKFRCGNSTGEKRQAEVSHTFVNNMRKSLETVSSQKRKGADGRTIDTSNIGNKKPPTVKLGATKGEH